MSLLIYELNINELKKLIIKVIHKSKVKNILTIGIT